jgi:hypothetical protein
MLTYAPYALLVLGIVAWSCGHETPPAADMPLGGNDSPGVTIVGSLRPAWVRPWTVIDSPSLRIGHTAGSPEQDLYRVTSALRLSDGRLVVANGGTNEIRWYSSSGDLLRASGGDGDGPGEFRRLGHVIPFSRDSVAASDFILPRYSVYDGDGNFVRTVTQRAVERQMLAPAARFSDGTSLWTTSGFVLGADGPIRVERLITSVYRISADGGSAEAVASLPWLEQVIAPSGGVRPDGSEVIGRSHRAFGRSSWVVADAEGWIFADNTAPEIEVRAIDGSLTRIIRWPAEPRLVTHEDIQRDAEWSFASSSRQEPAVRERVRRAREAHPAPPDTMPWFGCAPTPSCPGRPVLLDTDRNLWVQEYRPPAEGLSNRYEVFDSAGVWLGAVTMPADLEVLSIAYDHVVGVVRDDLDVESVAVYAIEKS